MLYRLIGFIFFVGLYSASAAVQEGCQVTVIESNTKAIILDISIDSITTIQKQTNEKWFTDVSFPGCAYMQNVGLPRLPITSVVIGIPPEGKPQLRVVSLEQTTESIGQIVPVEQIAANEFDGTIYPNEYSNASSLDGWYPNMVVSLGEVGFVRNQKIAQVEIHPIQYNARTQMTRVIRRMRIKVDFKTSAGVAATSSYAPKPSKDVDAFETFFAKQLPNYKSAQAWRRSLKRSIEKSTMAASTSNTSYKLTVEQDGIYYVTGRDLADVGVNLSDIDIQTLSLTNKGKPVPILVEGEGDNIFDEDDRIIFVGEFNRGENSYLSPYTLKNVYRLSWGGAPGLRFAEVSGLPENDNLEQVDAMRSCIHLEKDDTYLRFMHIPDESFDHWLWRTMSMGSEPRFELPVIEPIGERNAALRVAMRGLTYMPQSPDHHVIAKVNGVKVGEAVWDDQETIVLENSRISAAILSKDENILTFEFPGDLGVENDRVLLNWIEFEYDRQFVAVKDTLNFQYPEFHRGSKKQTTIWGFSQPEVYVFDSSGRRIVDFLVEKGEDSYSISFSNLAVADETYFAAAGSRLRPVQSIEKYVSQTLKSTGSGADYIIITHSDFMQDAARLAQFRETQGLRTLVVDVQSVYDEFSFGIYDPRAIKKFLAYAYANWDSPAPAYILLFGDTTHNFDKLVWNEDENKRVKYPTYVPTMMVYTSSWGMCSSDNYFVCVNGDDLLPDMFIGRLPTNSSEEAKSMVDKIIRYESDPTLGEWRNRICLATGNGDIFEYSTQYLYENYVPNRVNVSRISTNLGSPYFGSTEELVEIINNGAAILNFTGHGGGGVYFDAELFVIDDIKQLNNANKYPIAFSLTCYVGHFDNPTEPSLGEKMLMAPERGIVGHFGSSGRAYIYGDFYLNNALFDELFLKNQKVLGELTTYAKLGMISQAQAYWDHVKNFILLGDPATRISLANETVEVQLSTTSLNPGDTLSVTGTVKDASFGAIALSVYSEKDSLILTKDVSISDGKFSTDLFILAEPVLSAWPDEGGKGFVRAYYNDGQKDGVGGAEFFVLKPAISQVKVEPEAPAHHQDIFFSAHVTTSPSMGDEEPGQVRCLWSINKAQWTAINMDNISGNVYRTNTPIQERESLDVFYKIQAMDASGETVLAETPIHSVKIRKRSNLFCRPDYIQIGGKEKVELLIKIANIGETDAGDFKVRVYEHGVEPEAVEVGSPLHIEGLAAQTDTVITFIWPGHPVGELGVKVRIDSENQVEETTELDNIVTADFVLITTHDGTQGELISIDGNAAILVQANGVNKNSSIGWRIVANDVFEQAVAGSNCQKIKFAHSQEWAVYEITVADRTLNFTKPYQLRFYYDKTDAMTAGAVEQGYVKVFVWNPKLSIWNGLKTEIDAENGSATAEVENNYTNFTLLSSEDAEPPEITVSFEGQHFVEGDYVSETPTISIIVEDASGLEITQESISLELDGRKLGQQEYILFQNVNISKRLTGTFSPQLDPGDHRFKIQAIDIHGNFAAKEINFSVAGEFSLFSIANHPNPFIDVTVIAFSLTDKAATVGIDVFTSSGRRIWTMELADVLGYQEVDWDGTDMDGAEVANGVYYLKFCAKRGDEKIERIEKMAKLK